MLRAMDTENGANVWSHYDEAEIVCISNVKETVQYSNSFGMVAQLDARTGAVGGIQTAPLSILSFADRSGTGVRTGSSPGRKVQPVLSNSSVL